MVRVNHTGFPPFSTILYVHRRESQLLQVVLDDVDPWLVLKFNCGACAVVGPVSASKQLSNVSGSFNRNYS